jgi:exopolysaccharide biosynthesis operon protein EpsL
VVAVIALLLMGNAAQAQMAAPSPLGPLTIRAGYAIQSDNNLFRSSTNARSEQFGTATLGVGFVSNQGLQRFEANLSAVDSQYQTFTYLNNTATNYDLAWRWAVSPEWTGNLTTSRSEALNNFADTVNTTQRNQRVTTNSTLDTTYLLQGAWAALAGVSTNKQTNDLAVTGVDDFSSNTGNVGVQYRFASGNSLSFRSNFTNGSYLNRTVPNAVLADDSFKETGQDLRVHYVIGGSSAADVYLTAINRTHPTYPSRDYSGVNAGATVNWAITGKTSVAVAATHTLNAFETVNTNYTTTDAISITPVWQASPKIAVRLNAAWGQVAYQGSPSAVPALDRKDTTNDISVGVVWTPTQQWNLSAAVQQANRSSNLAGQNYDANILSLAATFTF